MGRQKLDKSVSRSSSSRVADPLRPLSPFAQYGGGMLWLLLARIGSSKEVEEGTDK
jgi:hypothetical protein